MIKLSRYVICNVRNKITSQVFSITSLFSKTPKNQQSPRAWFLKAIHHGYCWKIQTKNVIFVDVFCKWCHHFDVSVLNKFFLNIFFHKCFEEVLKLHCEPSTWPQVNTKNILLRLEVTFDRIKAVPFPKVSFSSWD